ncbi:hypothetical protein FHS79_003697 [Polymorphobacter multimanifer]|uniref:Uncharacterized protein n=1 Tax=Polymorphobacter multimanifer TaxID=1070431 RepID=A0A841LAD9_9SPHN|nr:hypothetical protein [Polymorphobacter multimanifer]
MANYNCDYGINAADRDHAWIHSGSYGIVVRPKCFAGQLTHRTSTVDLTRGRSGCGILKRGGRCEPRRVCRRLFGLSHATIADVLVMG